MKLWKRTLILVAGALLVGALGSRSADADETGCYKYEICTNHGYECSGGSCSPSPGSLCCKQQPCVGPGET